MTDYFPYPKPTLMWLILLGVTALSVVEAVKMEKRTDFKLDRIHPDSPDPASTLNRRI